MFNYPNHPLFRITPLLDRGFNTVLHDEYTSHLVGRIRAGRYTRDLWDCNSLILGYAVRTAAPADQQMRAAPSRYKMTAEELKQFKEEFNSSPEWLATVARRREAKTQRAAKEAEKARVRREYAEEQARFEQEFAETQAKRKAEKEQRDRDWLMVGAETQQYLTERAMIMAVGMRR